MKSVDFTYKKLEYGIKFMRRISSLIEEIGFSTSPYDLDKGQLNYYLNSEQCRINGLESFSITIDLIYSVIRYKIQSSTDRSMIMLNASISMSVSYNYDSTDQFKIYPDMSESEIQESTEKQFQSVREHIFSIIPKSLRDYQIKSIIDEGKS